MLWEGGIFSFLHFFLGGHNCGVYPTAAVEFYGKILMRGTRVREKLAKLLSFKMWFYTCYLHALIFFPFSHSEIQLHGANCNICSF